MGNGATERGLDVQDFDGDREPIVNDDPLDHFGGEDQTQVLLFHFPKADFGRDDWTFVGHGLGSGKLDPVPGVLEILLELAAVDPASEDGLGGNEVVVEHEEEISSSENWEID